jgi:predicted lactoylglutathione lyase
MAKDFWLSLPVKDINRSKAFFTEIGFKLKGGPGNTERSAPLVLGNKEVVVMLFEEPVFKGFVNTEIGDAAKQCEVLLSVDAASKEEVDEMAARAVAAGGKSGHQPYAMQGNMYGCVFSDVDGHRWNVLFIAQ